MSVCAAPNCTSRSRHGAFRFSRFPADPKRREIWVQNCGRQNWTPSIHSVLCHLHFEETQFEDKRMDGKKKLTNFAIPTVFNTPKVLQIKSEENVITKTQVIIKTEMLSHETSVKGREQNEWGVVIEPEEEVQNEENKCKRCKILEAKKETLSLQIGELKRQLRLGDSILTAEREKIAELRGQLFGTK